MMIKDYKLLIELEHTHMEQNLLVTSTLKAFEMPLK